MAERDETHPLWAEGLAAVDAGDENSLAALLERAPDLVAARARGVESPYEGYFQGATLLHHVAGNPYRDPLPENAVEIARLLLERGAEVDAGCGGGPAQPGSGDGTTLGLLASGRQALEMGLTEPMFDLLIEHGAAVDPTGSGGVMWGALYHVVESPRQLEAAELLLDAGHELDLCYAACFGDLEEVGVQWNGGAPGPEADRYMKNFRGHAVSCEPNDLLQDVLLCGVVHDQPDIVEWAHRQGAALDVLRPWGPAMITPLHGAVWAGWLEIAEWLVGRGADRSIVDPVHDSTPLGWAEHMGRSELVGLLDS